MKQSLRSVILAGSETAVKHRFDQVNIMNRFEMIGLASLLFCVLTGCKDPRVAAEPEEPKREATATGIIGQTTQDIGEYDPAAGAKVSDGKMKPTSPLNPLGAMNAYKPAVERLMKLQVQQALNFFQAAKGRYPKDHAEFMEQVIRANQIKLAVLPGNWVYQYDVQNHELVVVEDSKTKTP